jgi:hypothetical protein
VAGPLADASSGPIVIAIAAASIIFAGAWSATFFGPRPHGAAPA